LRHKNINSNLPGKDQSTKREEDTKAKLLEAGEIMTTDDDNPARTNSSNTSQTPDFDSIRQVSVYGAEYWSARDLAPLLGYDKWERFDGAIKRAMTACHQVGQVVENHFPSAGKMVTLGSGSQREVKDYFLSRFACYVVAQNGDPRKPEIAAAQAYFATATREYEIQQLEAEQDKRLQLREQISENNKALADAARRAGVLSPNFGVFQEAGYQGLYGGLGVVDLKERKGISPKEDLLDRMGRQELAANDFRITQTEAKLRKEQIIGQTNAIKAHRQVGETVRKAIEEIGGTMPEELPAEPSIKPLLEQKKRKKKKALPQQGQAAFPLEEEAADKVEP
jgi:DNA-damage-inducible protein D